MNMDELFAMGFCKAAEEHGVDPVQLAKYAADTKLVFNPVTGRYAYPNSSAGIGSHSDNGNWGQIFWPISGSYAEALTRNVQSMHQPEFVRSRAEGRLSDAFKGEGDVTLSDLLSARRRQAVRHAGEFYPEGSVPWKKVVDNLIRAGAENYKAYLRTGDVPKRKEPDLKGVEQLHLDKDLLKEIQNTMVRNGKPTAVANIA